MIRTALKSLLGRKLRLIMSTFAIVLGVAFVVGTLVFTDTLNKSFTSIFASGVGDVVVQADGADDVPGGGFTTKRVSGDLVDTLADVPGAARADGRAGADGVYVLKKSDGKPIGGFGPPSLGGNWTDAPAGHGLEGLEITEGREPEGADEVVLDARTAEKAGYDVGDTVELLTQGEQSRLSATLVGIADYRDGGSLNGATLAAFDTATAQDLFYEGRDEFTSIWVTAEEGVTQEQLRAEVEKVLPDGYEAVTGDESADKRAEDLLEGISFLTTFLLIFAGIALFVGSFIIVNTFSILVAQRSRELALLRALGASKKQVVRSVQLEAFILGLLGATFGIALGVLLAMALRALFGAIGLDLTGQPLVFAPRSFIAAYVVGVLVTMTAAYFPARRTSKIAPVQAMRDDIALPEESLRQRFRRGLALFVLGCVLLVVGLDDVVHVPKSGWVLGAGLFAILLGVTVMSPVLAGPVLRAARVLYSRVFGSIGNLAAQNSLRNPRRTAATASALMIGLTLACTMAIVGASAKATIDKSVETGFTGDYVVSSIFDGGFSPTIAEDVAQVPGVDKVLRQRTDFATYDGGFAVVVGTDVATLDALGVDVVNGSTDDLEKKDRAVVDEVFASEEGLEPGDTFEIDVNAGTVTWKVAAVIKANVLLQGIIVSTDTFEARRLPGRGHGAGRVRRGRCRQGAAAARPRRGAEGPAHRHRARPGGVRQGPARRRRPVRQHHLRAARPRPRDRGARHRQHARALGDRADPRGRPAAGHRRHASPAAADDHARVGRHRRPRSDPRRRPRHRHRRGPDAGPARRGPRRDLGATRPAGRSSSCWPWSSGCSRRSSRRGARRGSTSCRRSRPSSGRPTTRGHRDGARPPCQARVTTASPPDRAMEGLPHGAKTGEKARFARRASEPSLGSGAWRTC